MPSLWFVVPAYGRIELTRICLRQLSRTCQELTEGGIQASAVVVADDENLETATALGFATVERDNTRFGQRWNDGYEAVGRAGIDYAVPLGSDDWIDPRLLLDGELPGPSTIRCSRLAGFVREDGRRLARLRIPYEGGIGIRVIPTALLRQVDYRPATPARARAIDTDVLRRLTMATDRRLTLTYHDLHPLQILDWKSGPSLQLNPYSNCLVYLDGAESSDPLGEIAQHYPREAVDEMRSFYACRLRVAG